MANFNLPLDPTVLSTVLAQNSGTLNGSTVSGTLYTYSPVGVDTSVSNTNITGTLTNNINNILVTSSNITSSNVTSTILVSNTISSFDSNNQVIFDNTNNRTLIVARGFKFKNDNGIITPVNKTKQLVVTGNYGTANTQTSFVVPAGVYYIFVKMWGAAGGGGAYGGWRYGAHGGAGGYSHGLIPVKPGDTFTIRAGSAGIARYGASAGWPDGGAASTAGSDNRYAGSGGGSSSVATTSLNSGIWCMFAGAGGGGGACNGYAKNGAGAGGGLVGESGYTTNYTAQYNTYGTTVGKGGTQSAGGVAPIGDNTTGGAGSYNQGGTHQNAGAYAGGGGGGYYGGSSGCYNSGNSMSGGGGGSGYIHPSIIMGALFGGKGTTPGNPNDSDLQYDGNNDYAAGGDEDSYGGPGLIVLYY